MIIHNSFYILRQTLQIAPMLASALEALIHRNDNEQSVNRVDKLIIVLTKNLRAECFASLQEVISEIFTESTAYFKSPLEVLRWNYCCDDTVADLIVFILVDEASRMLCCQSRATWIIRCFSEDIFAKRWRHSQGTYSLVYLNFILFL